MPFFSMQTTMASSRQMAILLKQESDHAPGWADRGENSPNKENRKPEEAAQVRCLAHLKILT
jgi:hypothetical protein